jgi:hypothetical protein
MIQCIFLFFFLQGTLHLYETGNAESLKLLKDVHWGTVMGIGCLTGNEYVIVSICVSSS